MTTDKDTLKLNAVYTCESWVWATSRRAARKAFSKSGMKNFAVVEGADGYYALTRGGFGVEAAKV